jgi:hypothetical protein
MRFALPSCVSPYCASQALFLAVAVTIVVAQLVFVPFDAQHSNGLVSSLGYHFFWSPPSSDHTGVVQVQGGIVAAEVCSTLVAAYLTFPRG